MKTLVCVVAFIFCFFASAFEYKKYMSEFSAPFQTPMVYYFGAGTALSLGLKYAAFDQVVKPFQEDISRKDLLGDFSEPLDQFGKVVPNLIYIGASSLYAYYYQSKRAYTLSETMFKATLYSSVLACTMKFTFQEERPNKASNLSFPSGHSTTAFAFASVVAANHEWYYGVPAYLAASLVALQRLNSNNHYLHDVIMGATIGTTYGLSLSKKIAKDNALVPIVEGEKRGLLWIFGF